MSNDINNSSLKQPMQFLNTYMVKGIIDSGIIADGGLDCYNEIPKVYHLSTAIISVIVHVLILWKWNESLVEPQQNRLLNLKSSLLEKFVALNCFISLALTFYFKLVTGKGIFIFNPCHMSLLVLFILLVLPTSKFTLKLNTCWSAFLFGPLMALTLPHLYGISQFEVYLYYYEHLLILPIGPLILYRRYGYAKPNFMNQMASFSTVLIYQFVILMPLSMTTTVNLNFVLCHSPADPWYPLIGYYYMTFFVFFLNFSSWVTRWICFALVWPSKHFYESKGVQKEKERVQSTNKGKTAKRE